MLISKISQTMQGELRKVDGTRAKEAVKEAPRRAKETDRSEFSASGKIQSETKGEVQIITSMLKAHPDVRMDKVEEVRAKVSSGFYNSGMLVDKLADKLAATFV